jgi:hypothetical protein
MYNTFDCLEILRMQRSTLLVIIPLIFSVGIIQAFSSGEEIESPKTHSDDMFESPITHMRENPIAYPHDYMIPSPRIQMENEIAAEDVICKSGFDLMIRNSGSAACVSPSTAERLASVGWGIIL